MVAFQGQGTLVSAERRELVGQRLILIGQPVAQAADTRRSCHPALTFHPREYFHFLRIIRRIINEGERERSGRQIVLPLSPRVFCVGNRRQDRR